MTTYKEVNDNLLKVLGEMGELRTQVAEMKLDMRYVKEHVSVINDELGQCVGRLDTLEKCNVEHKAQEKQKRYDWKLIFGVAGATGAILTAIYYALTLAKVIA